MGGNQAYPEPVPAQMHAHIVLAHPGVFGQEFGMPGKIESGPVQGGLVQGGGYKPGEEILGEKRAGQFQTLPGQKAAVYSCPAIGGFEFPFRLQKLYSGGIILE